MTHPADGPDQGPPWWVGAPPGDGPDDPAGFGGYRGPTGGWSPRGPYGPVYPPPRRRHPVLALLGSAVVVAVAAGVLGGHLVWPAATSPGAGLGPLPQLPTPSAAAPKNGPAAAGAPADAARLARQTDPALVDITTTNAYQALAGAATGLVLSPSGEVLTNNHVVEGATGLRVTDIGNRRSYRARVVGYDRAADLAVLQLVGASGLATVRLASGPVGPGAGVVVVGNAEGAGGTPAYAAGAVTGIGRSITAHDPANGGSERLSGLIQTDADVVPGDSGGALVAADGTVAGVVVAGSQSLELGAAAAAGFAIPIRTAAALAARIAAGRGGGEVHVGPTAFLGVTVTAAPAGVAGARVVAVVPGGPAAAAGVTPGDTITSVAARGIGSPDALTALLLGQAPGTAVRLGYLDPSGADRAVVLRLGSGPPQ